ncbi:transposase [Sagittula sp. NFXS13]|uniref:transposase n=1 Tax=Sagittula sp. NFXS13 TaxID=2819095 RepID=UPI0032DE2CC2
MGHARRSDCNCVRGLVEADEHRRRYEAHEGTDFHALCLWLIWGSALPHQPHIHMIASEGGLSQDGTRWAACKPRFFLDMRVMMRLYRCQYRGLPLDG